MLFSIIISKHGLFCGDNLARGWCLPFIPVQTIPASREKEKFSVVTVLLERGHIMAFFSQQYSAINLDRRSNAMFSTNAHWGGPL
jgi:hypothetical protein